VRLRPCFNEDVLQNVLGLGSLTQDPNQQSEQQRAMRVVELGYCALVAVRYALQKGKVLSILLEKGKVLFIFLEKGKVLTI
jgi:hypothetical protein